MKPFVFSADGHVREPKELFTDALPPSMHKYGLRSERDGNHMLVMAGSKILFRLPTTPLKGEAADFGRPNQKGATDLTARFEDLRNDGVDAEILFPTTGLMTCLLENSEAELASVQAYNDWISTFVGDRLDIFVRCGILPIRDDFKYTVQEMKRLEGMGFTAAMIPSKIPAGVPNYNNPVWDPVFEAAQNTRIVLVCHTATGREDVRFERGPGGALINYTHQMLDAQETVMYMVGGGILDRFPGAKVAFIESGASWLAAVAERLDEVFYGHHFFVAPKLSLTPREIIQRQIHASFQTDRACIMSRSVTGHRAIMWGADYPHHEGTFPNSKKVVGALFDGIDISEQEKADIIGGNAARLFRLQRPEFMQAA